MVRIHLYIYILFQLYVHCCMFAKRRKKNIKASIFIFWQNLNLKKRPFAYKEKKGHLQWDLNPPVMFIYHFTVPMHWKVFRSSEFFYKYWRSDKQRNIFWKKFTFIFHFWQNQNGVCFSNKHNLRTLADYCPDVQTKIVDQMNAWDNEDCGTKPGDTEPNGQKCLYHVSTLDFRSLRIFIISTFSRVYSLNW